MNFFLLEYSGYCKHGISIYELQQMRTQNAAYIGFA